MFTTDTKTSSTVLTIEIPGTTSGNQETTFAFMLSDNGGKENCGSDLTALLTTFWIFDTTTLSPSSGSRSIAFRFTGTTPTEIAIQSEHTHVTVNNVEVHVNLSGLLTKIEVTESTTTIVALPGATAALKILGETSEFNITAFTIATSDIASS